MSDFIPDRLNEVPAVFGGCSWEELGSIAVISFVSLLLISILLGIATGLWIAMPALVLVGTLVSVFITSKVMMSAKRGKPTGYYSTRIAIIKKNWGLANPKIIIKSRTWDIGR